MANIEDRRNEWTDMQHMLMSLGFDPPEGANSSHARLKGLGPGEYLDIDNEENQEPLSRLSIDAGVGELLSLINTPKLQTINDPIARRQK